MNAEHKKVVTKEGKTILMRYNKKYKTWVKLHFSDEDIGVAKYVTEVLGQQYIDREVEKTV